MNGVVTLDLLLVVVLGAVVGAGVVLLVSALRARPVRTGPADGSLVDDLRRLAVAAGRRVPLAVGAGLLTLVLTRWVVLAGAVTAAALLWDQLFGGGREEDQAVERLDGLATWVESLRDTVAGAVGLEQAIPATAYAAPPSVAGPLRALADRLAVRIPLTTALRRFAEDLDDASADLVIAALLLNARLRGPGLREVLGSLAQSTREELDMRRRISSQRRSTRRSVQIIMAFTIAVVLLLRFLNPQYLAPYSTLVGQLVLVVVVGMFAAGFVWMRRLAKYSLPERFLQGDPQRVTT